MLMIDTEAQDSRLKGGAHIAREDLIQQHAIGIHIRAVIDRLPVQHLGRRVSQRVRVPDTQTSQSTS